MTLSVNDHLALARRQACRDTPYLAPGLWRMTFVQSDKLPTLAIDRRWRVYVNPAFVLECVVEGSLVGGLIHECLHPTLRHATRAEAIHAHDADRWNAAGDRELNERIVQARSADPRENHLREIKLPSCGLRAQPGRVHWSAEEHYRADPKTDGGKPKPGAGNGGSKPWAGGDGDPKPDPCSGGSGATGKSGAWEITEGSAEDARSPGVSEAEAEVIRAQIAQATLDHVARHGIGSVPTGMLRWAEEYGTPPQVDWASLTTAAVAYALSARKGPTASYARPSRRESGGLVLPTHRRPNARVGIVGDTSASMGDSDMGAVIATVYEAVEALGSVFALGCDAQAAEPVEVRHIEDLREALVGGGGTDMCAGIAKMTEDVARLDAIVVVTDGGTGWPAEAPEIPLVVVLTPGAGGYAAPPAYAQVIEVK